MWHFTVHQEGILLWSTCIIRNFPPCLNFPSNFLTYFTKFLSTPLISMIIQMEQSKFPFWELFENPVYRNLYWKVTSSKNGPKRAQNFSNRLWFFLLVLGPLRDLCAKFQPHTIFSRLKPNSTFYIRLVLSSKDIIA